MFSVFKYKMPIVECARQLLFCKKPFRENSGLMVGNYSGGLELYNRDAEIFPAIAEQAARLNFSISPNPASDFLYVELTPHSGNDLFYRIF